MPAGSTADCTDVVALDALLRATLPASGAHGSMEYVASELRGPMVAITMQLVLWNTVVVDGEERRAITDVKEQQIAGAPAATSFARFQAYVEAWVAVLTRVFASDAERDALDTLMPHDLVKSDVLALKTAHTKDDFEHALMQRSRLGKWLAASMPRRNVDEHGDGDGDEHEHESPELVRDESL